MKDKKELYKRLTENEEDYILLLEAYKRLKENGDKKTISIDLLMNDLGITEEELSNMEDVFEIFYWLKILLDIYYFVLISRKDDKKWV